MDQELLSKWLAHYDPIHRGYSPRGIANGVCAMCGWAFPRVNGGYNLYRGASSAEQIDYAVPVGACGPSESTRGPGVEKISTFPWRGHDPDTEYFYVVRAVGGGGVESDSSSPAVSIAVDSAGTVLGGRANAVGSLSAEPLADGRFLLRWSYSTLGEEAPPIAFVVYSDGGSGVVDYQCVIGMTPYQHGRCHFEFLTGTHAHGAVRLWNVVPRTAGERSMPAGPPVRACADAVGPDPLPTLIAETVAE